MRGAGYSRTRSEGVQVGVDDVVALLEEAATARGRAGTWVGLIERLLRVGHEDAWWRDASTDERRLFEELVTDLDVEWRVACGDLLSARVDETTVQQLIEVLHDSRPALDAFQGPVGLAVCHSLANVLDDTMMVTGLMDRFRDTGELLLQPGEIHPVGLSRMDPRPLLAGMPTSDPANLAERRLDATRHLALGSQRTARYRFVLDWDATGRLADLAGRSSLRVGCSQPNLTLEEFDIQVHREEGGLAPAFRNLGPNGGEQAERLLEQLPLAAAASADVLVYPEYTVPLEARDEVEHALDELGAQRPSVVVGGTAERLACEDQHDHGANCVVVNEAVLWFRDGAATLRKLIPARMDTGVEGISGAGGEVRVFVSGDWALCVLVCRDAMSVDIHEQLVEVGVSLLLVPAMSGKTTTLVERATSITSWTQAFVAVAVAPAQWFDDDRERDRVQAAYHGPDAASLGPDVAPALADRPRRERGLWVFDSNDRSAVTFRSG